MGKRAELETDVLQLWCCADAEGVVCERPPVTDSEQGPFTGGSDQVHKLTCNDNVENLTYFKDILQEVFFLTGFFLYCRHV